MYRSAIIRFLIALAFVLAAGSLHDGAIKTGYAQSPPQGSGLPLPRFVSLRADEVNMRAGPGVRYPVDWIFKRKNMPVEVIAEFGTWRRVRDIQGTQGWIHQSMLSNRRSFSVVGQTRTIRRKAAADSPPVAKIEPGAIGEVLECAAGAGWCRVSADGFEGWLRRVEIWGVYPQEVIK